MGSFAGAVSTGCSAGSSARCPGSCTGRARWESFLCCGREGRPARRCGCCPDWNGSVPRRPAVLRCDADHAQGAETDCATRPVLLIFQRDPEPPEVCFLLLCRVYAPLAGARDARCVISRSKQRSPSMSLRLPTVSGAFLLDPFRRGGDRLMPRALSRPLSTPSASEIEHCRAEIDHVDRVLVRLLNLRARLALKVAGLKRRAGLPLHAPGRE